VACELTRARSAWELRQRTNPTQARASADTTKLTAQVPLVLPPRVADHAEVVPPKNKPSGRDELRLVRSASQNNKNVERLMRQVVPRQAHGPHGGGPSLLNKKSPPETGGLLKCNLLTI
jgi:hypothetical protein